MVRAFAGDSTITRGLATARRVKPGPAEKSTTPSFWPLILGLWVEDRVPVRSTAVDRSPVHDHRLAADLAGGVGGQPDHGLGDLVGVEEVARGDGRGHHPAQPLVVADE